MPTKIYRLTMPWGSNLYRWSGTTYGSGWPIGIQSYNKHPGVRKVIGRWSDCPNWSVATRLRDRKSA